MDKEKLQDRLSQIRKKSVELDRAITEAKRAKKIKEAKNSKPQTKGETVNTTDLHEQIITEGTSLEKSLLYVRDFDLRNTFGKGLLKDEQKKRLRTMFKNETKPSQILTEVGKLYDGIVNYTKYLIAYRKMWQTEAGNLALLCQKWESADLLADTITKTYYTQILPLLAKLEAEEVSAPTGDIAYSEESFSKFVSSIWSNQVREQGITPKIEKSGTNEVGRQLFKVVADVDGENGLYSKILKQRDEAERMLELYRSALEPLSDFLTSDVYLQIAKKKIIPYIQLLPYNTEQIVDCPDTIQFMFEKGAEKYFAYKLRLRREQGDGDSITPEEIKRAVIPDYNEVSEVERTVKNSKEQLNHYLPYHYDPDRDYKADGTNK